MSVSFAKPFNTPNAPPVHRSHTKYFSNPFDSDIMAFYISFFFLFVGQSSSMTEATKFNNHEQFYHAFIGTLLLSCRAKLNSESSLSGCALTTTTAAAQNSSTHTVEHSVGCWQVIAMRIIRQDQDGDEKIDVYQQFLISQLLNSN